MRRLVTIALWLTISIGVTPSWSSVSAPDMMFIARPAHFEKESQLDSLKYQTGQEFIFVNQALAASLYKPQNKQALRYLPAVVLLPDCKGVMGYQRRWAQQLAEWGYAALLLDRFRLRPDKTPCSGPSDSKDNADISNQIQDAYAGLDYLATLLNIDRTRIGLMGWTKYSVLGSVAHGGEQRYFKRRFKTAIAFDPDCRATPDGIFVARVLAISSAKSKAGMSKPACQSMRQKAISANDIGATNVTLKSHVNTKSGFLSARLYAELQQGNQDIPDWLLSAVGLEDGLHSFYLDRLTVFEFLNEKLRHGSYMGTLDDLAQQFSPAALESASWSISPNQIESTLPSLGHSLFDEVFSRYKEGESGYMIPFPFTKLLDHLKRYIKPGTATSESLSIALFPMGRSLQRDVAAPDFFQYPRVVVGVEEEPANDGKQRQLLLKDRLFIAYVEKTATLEIISYNPEAGRFEFQVVENYREGAQPRVVYPRREICTSCHQNRAPIFPNAPWLETDINPAIAEGISQQDNAFYTALAKDRNFAVSNLDLSINRANFLITANVLWNQLCRSERLAETMACRASLYKAILQFKLSNGHRFAYDQAFEKDFIRLAASNWLKLWPGGLKIPFANIPDRDPLALKGEIPAAIDPIARRSPEKIWRWDADILPAKIITEMSKQLLYDDVDSLNAAIRELSLQQEVETTTYQLKCTKSVDKSRGITFALALRCFDPRGSAGLVSKFVFSTQIEGHGRIVQLKLGDHQTLVGAELRSLSASATRRSFKPESKDYKRTIRLSNGDALVAVHLNTPTENPTSEVWLDVLVRQDFALINTAVNTFIDSGGEDSPFSLEMPLSFDALNRVVFDALGIEYSAICCNEADQLPAPVVKTIALPKQLNSQIVGLFSQNCGVCHASGNAVPPSFLSGSQTQAMTNLKSCAQRINYRLNMWRINQAARKKAPMPPYPMSGHAPNTWASSDEYASLLQAALGLLPADDNKLSILLKQPYATLEQCQPVLSLSRLTQ